MWGGRVGRGVQTREGGGGEWIRLDGRIEGGEQQIEGESREGRVGEGDSKEMMRE